MALTALDEEYHQMTLEDYFDQEIKPDLFAVSRIFANARKQMTLSEYKAFTMALCSVKWKEACPDTIYLDKKEVAKAVGIRSDVDHLSVNLNRSIGELPHHSFLKFSDKDKDTYFNGNFVRTIAFFKNKVRIKLEPDFLDLFGNLDKNYITMWSGDIYKMHSERAIKFYELLRENSDTRISVNKAEIGIKTFKDLFGIPKDGEGSYMRKAGHFDRPAFEKRVIEPICQDLIDTEMIKLIIQPNGKYYEKIKRNGRVLGYRFHWIISMYPRVANASEVQQIQERADKNPEVLKIARDLLVKENKSKKQKDNSFVGNMEPTGIDYDAIAQEKIRKRMSHDE